MARALSTAAAALVLCGSLLMIATSVQAYASTLLRGFTINTDEFISTDNFKFIMQQDCNLVLYQDEDIPIWASNTGGRTSGGCHLIFEENANLAIYNVRAQVIWTTGTNGTSGAYINAQCDGNVVMYSGEGHSIWATNTVAMGQRVAIDLEEGNRLRKPSIGTRFVQTVLEANQLAADKQEQPVPF